MAKTTQYKKEYCEMLIKHMSQGYSFGSFGAVVGNGRKTLYDWCNAFPEFAEAKAVGTEKAKRMMERIALAKVVGSKQTSAEGGIVFDPKLSDTTMLIFLMKTRFHDTYGDKKEHSFSEPVEVTLSYKKEK